MESTAEMWASTGDWLGCMLGMWANTLERQESCWVTWADRPATKANMKASVLWQDWGNRD